MNNEINIWHLGGASVKISTHMHLEDTKNVLPKLNKIFIDTSTSEESMLPPGEELHVLVLDRAGSGQVKAVNYDEISAQVPAIVDTVNPTDINFVIFNGSGASGSTMGHVVVNTLLKEGKSVVVFFSSTPDNLVRGRNTNKTLGGLDNLAKTHKCVLPLVLSDSTVHGGYTPADETLANSVLFTAAMLNEDIVGLDDSDRRNFLNPLNMPDNELGVKPGLYELLVVTGRPKEPTTGVAAAMTLVPFGVSDNIGTDASTIFSGKLTDDIVSTFLAGEKGGGATAISLLLSPENIYHYSTKVEEDNVGLSKTAALNARDRSISTAGNVGGDGIIL